MKGNLTISRGSDNIVRIRVEDESSRIEFLEVEMSLEDFAQALFNRCNLPCEYELRGMKNVGKVRENKTEVVTVTISKKHSRANAEEIKAALAPFEVDGWTGRGEDVNNHHHYIGQVETTEGRSYRARVHFTRFVDAVEPESHNE